jgi:hypothetical protein
MNVQIRFMGVIADIAGTKQQTLGFDGVPTLRGLLTELERQHGPEFGSRIFRGSSAPRLLQMCTRIFLNKHIVDDRALDQPLPVDAGAAAAPEVLVYFLPAVCGG